MNRKARSKSLDLRTQYLDSESKDMQNKITQTITKNSGGYTDI